MESAGASIAAGPERINSLVRYIIQSHDDADFSQASSELRIELAAIPAHQRKFIVALAVGSEQTTALLQRMAL